MRKIIYLAVLALLASKASAAAFETNYKKNTIVPEVLKDKIAKAIYNRFSCLTELYELTTTSSSVTIDQGMVDHYYSTVFVGNLSDEHSTNVEIKVDSVEYAIYSLPNTDILSVVSDHADNICP